MLRFTFKTFARLNLSILCIALFSGCEDIFEADLTEQNLILLSPPNNTSVEQLNVQFIWEELEDAEEYQLQVVHPDFTFIESYTLDTTIADHMFSLQLSPDDYQWRVRGKNGSSETEWFTWNLQVDSI